MHRFHSQSVHITDIAAEFVESTQALIGTSSTPAFYYACDANQLPFTSGSFDTVVGNSVLHHFLDYTDILKRIHDLLRPGGRAVFYEPVLQGKIMVAFLSDLMLRIERHTSLAGFDQKDIRVLETVIQHITKGRKIGNDRDKLASMEDKYIFDIHEMNDLGKSLGYREVSYQNSPQDTPAFRINFWPHLKMAGIDETKLGKYRFLLNVYKETMIDMLPRDMITPMGYFIFTR